MAHTECSCETGGTASASLIIDGDVANGTIIAAKIGDGVFTTSTHERLTCEENRRFMARALGSSYIGDMFVALRLPLVADPKVIPLWELRRSTNLERRHWLAQSAAVLQMADSKLSGL